LLLCALVSCVLAARPPLGTKSLSEQMRLMEKRANRLHKPIDGVVDLKADFFDRYIHPKQHRNKSRYWLVFFYSSWCITCDEFLEPLTQLAQKLHERLPNEDQIRIKQRDTPRGQLSIGKHDATTTEVITMKYDVEGFPTLLLFDRDDANKRVRYEGEHTFDGLLDFIREHTDVRI